MGAFPLQRKRTRERTEDLTERADVAHIVTS